MSENFSAFFRKNVYTKDEIIEYKPSERFSESFKLKAITEEEHSNVKRAATVRKPINGRRGQYTTEMDSNKYTYLLCAASTVYPNLNNAELQDTYGVKNPEDLLKAMFISGEFTDYLLKVQEINGFEKGNDELIEEAKN